MGTCSAAHIQTLFEMMLGQTDGILKMFHYPDPPDFFRTKVEGCQQTLIVYNKSNKLSASEETGQGRGPTSLAPKRPA